MNLARIEKVELREVWRHEALDFTNWLAKPENLELLSDEIGIDISLIRTEASVGSFNVDILAEETNTGKKIVIENQLELTDHDHLGKIITYASGLDAEMIIWIVKSVRDEHKQAIDWLNDHTDSGINIFAIQMQVWKISDSPCAAKFQVVAQPNDWAKAIKTVQNNGKLTDTKILQLDFWTAFREFVTEKGSNIIKLRKAYAQHWYDISIGSSLAHICLTINSQSEQIGCEIYIPDSKSLFTFMFENKDMIERDLGEELKWDELPTKKASRIKLLVSGDLLQKDSWGNYHKWMFEKAESFQKVFGAQLRKFSN